MGGSSSKYSEYRSISEAHEAVDIILRENPHLSYESRATLRDLRTDIYNCLDGETSARISIYLKGEYEPYKFKIGGGSQHLIVNIDDELMSYKFTTGRWFTRFKRGAASFFGAIVRVLGPVAGALLSSVGVPAIGWF